MEKFNESDIFLYLKSQDDYFDEFSDPKWFQAMQDSVIHWNKTRGTNYDPYDTVIDYVKETFQEQ